MSVTLPQPARYGLLLLALVAAFAVAYTIGHSGSSSTVVPIKSLKLTSGSTQAIPSVSTPASLPTMHTPPAPKTTTSSGGGGTTSSPAPTTSVPAPTPTTPPSSGGGGGGGGGPVIVG